MDVPMQGLQILYSQGGHIFPDTHSLWNSSWYGKYFRRGKFMFDVMTPVREDRFYSTNYVLKKNSLRFPSFIMPPVQMHINKAACTITYAQKVLRRITCEPTLFSRELEVGPHCPN